MSLSNYLETALLNHAFCGTPYTQPAGIYLSLHTANPNEGNDGHEISGGSYARQSITGSVASGVFTAGSMPLDFPTATGSWGTVTHVGIFDALTNGNLLAYGALTTQRAIGDGDVYRQTSLTVSLD
jgi:hypothetical protein